MRLGIILAGATLLTPLVLGAAHAAPALHGFCLDVACADDNKGGNTVTTSISPAFTGADWGFWISSGPATGNFDVVLAVPNNESKGGGITISGSISGTPVSQVATDLHLVWNGSSSDLATTLGTTNLPGGASPTDPESNFIGFTQSVDPGATGYELYLASFSSQQLLGMNKTTGMDLSAGLSAGTMIFGFLQQGNSWDATASSGALFDDAPTTGAPEPGSLALLGVGLLGLTAVARRRRT
jgi:hypothetical protein